MCAIGDMMCQVVISGSCLAATQGGLVKGIGWIFLYLVAIESPASVHMRFSTAVKPKEKYRLACPNNGGLTGIFWKVFVDMQRWQRMVGRM